MNSNVIKHMDSTLKNNEEEYYLKPTNKNIRKVLVIGNELLL